MIVFKNDTSNNISFPAERRMVMLLLDGQYYRLEVLRNEAYVGRGKRKSFDEAQLYYNLYVENKKNKIAQIHITLSTNNNNYNEHDLMHFLGHREVPSDFFELNSIIVEDSYHGIGTAFLSYVMNDIVKFNKIQGKTIKVLLQRVNSEITIPFYDKFGAVDNHAVNLNDIQEECMKENLKRVRFMIINKPKVVGELPIELADDFDYSLFYENNPYMGVERQ